MREICLRRKVTSKLNIATLENQMISKWNEDFADCIGEKCPLRITQKDLESLGVADADMARVYCMDLIALQAGIGKSLFMADKPAEEKADEKPKEKKTVRGECLRCHSTQELNENGFCGWCSNFRPEECKAITEKAKKEAPEGEGPK